MEATFAVCRLGARPLQILQLVSAEQAREIEQGGDEVELFELVQVEAGELEEAAELNDLDELN